MTEPTSPLQEFEQKLADEYGKWKAKAVIMVGNARAFNVGDPVPVSHVTQYHYDEQDLVEPADAAEPASSEPAAPQPAAVPVPPAAQPVQPVPAQEPSEG